MKILFTTEELKRIISFVKAMEAKNGKFYDAKGQTSVQKRLKDKLVGTVAEMWLNKFLNADYQDSILELYSKNRPSKFESDLVKGKLKISVKSQTVSAVERFGPGWVYEIKDPIIQGNSDSNYIAGIIIDDKVVEGKTYSESINFWEVVQLCWIPANEIHKYLVPTKLYPNLKVFLDLNLIPTDVLEKYNSDFKNFFVGL